eukprot:329016-Hanusia_phi.AAC.3
MRAAMKVTSIGCLLVLSVVHGNAVDVARFDALLMHSGGSSRKGAAFVMPGLLPLASMRKQRSSCRSTFQAAKFCLHGRYRVWVPLCMQDKDANEANDRSGEKNANASTMLEGSMFESDGEEFVTSIEEARLLLMRMQNTSEMSNETLLSTKTTLQSRKRVENDTMATSKVVSAVVIGKVIIDEFVLRKQPEGKLMRVALGGGGPQAAIGARLWHVGTGLLAPVGQEFADEIFMGSLEFSDVDTQGISRVKGFVTPRNQIRYESERMVWTPGDGWESWMSFIRQDIPIPSSYTQPLVVHMITEGCGASETRLSERLVEHARFKGGGENSKQGRGKKMKGPFLSVEPVIHDVSIATLETLREHTAKADFICPDWDTALKISRLIQGTVVKVSGSNLHPKLMGRWRYQPLVACCERHAGMRFLAASPTSGVSTSCRCESETSRMWSSQSTLKSLLAAGRKILHVLLARRVRGWTMVYRADRRVNYRMHVWEKRGKLRM